MPRQDNLTKNRRDVYTRHSMSTDIRATEDNRIGGYAVAFTSPDEPDLYREYFHDETDFWLEDKDPKSVHLLYQHGYDEAIGLTKIGAVEILEQRANELEDGTEGIWMEAQIYSHVRYLRQLIELIEMGILSISSGALGHMVRTTRVENSEGDSVWRIDSWPIGEVSLTPNPAEPRYTNASVMNNIRTRFKSLDLDTRPLVELLPGWVEEGAKDAEDESKQVDMFEAEFIGDAEKETHFHFHFDDIVEDDDVIEDKKTDNKAVEGETDGEENPAPKEDEIKGQYDMKNYILALVNSWAVGQRTILNDEQKQAIADFVYALCASKSGSDEFDETVVNLVVDNPQNMEQINERILAHNPEHQAKLVAEEAAAAQVLADAEALTEQERIDEAVAKALAESEATRKVEQEKEKGRGGFSTVPLADSQPGAGVSGADASVIFDLFKKNKFEQLGETGQLFYHQLSKSMHNARGTSYRPEEAFTSVFMDTMVTTVKNNAGSEFMKDPNSADGWSRGLKAMDYAERMVRTGRYKADEVFHSTNVGNGDEWVPDLWSMVIWEQIRAANPVFNLFPRVNMPSNPYNLVLRGDPGESFRVPETQDKGAQTDDLPGIIPIHTPVTIKQQIEAFKMGSQVIVATEAVEDIQVDVLNAHKDDLMYQMMNGLDFTLLNADPTTDKSDNRGRYAASGTFSGTDTWRGLVGYKGITRQAFDGFATDGDIGAAAGGTAHLRAEATLTLSELREGMRYLSPYFYSTPSGMCWIMSPEVEVRLREIQEYIDSEIQTGGVTGQVGSLDLIPVVTSFALGLADADGRINEAVASNTKGRALLVNKDSFRVGFRRQIQTGMMVNFFNDDIQVGTLVRVGFIRKKENRNPHHLQYNITV